MTSIYTPHNTAPNIYGNSVLCRTSTFWQRFFRRFKCCGVQLPVTTCLGQKQAPVAFGSGSLKLLKGVGRTTRWGKHAPWTQLSREAGTPSRRRGCRGGRLSRSRSCRTFSTAGHLSGGGGRDFTRGPQRGPRPTPLVAADTSRRRPQNRPQPHPHRTPTPPGSPHLLTGPTGSQQLPMAARKGSARIRRRRDAMPGRRGACRQ